MNIYFDPAFYDLEYDVRSDDIPFYKEQCHEINKIVKDPIVLELGCGTGRVTIPLASAGFKVTGVDSHRGMLDLAIKKARDVKIDFVQADFTSFKLKTKFDIILMPYNAFQHIHEDRDVTRFFNNLKTHMNKGCRFIMEVMNPLDDDLSREPDDFAPFDAFYVKKETGGALVRVNKDDSEAKILVIEDTVVFDPMTKVASYKLYYSLDGEDLFTKKIDLRMYKEKELKELLMFNNFNILNVYGDFNKKPLKYDSQSIVILAELKC